jgi:hypothetical protein
MIRMIKSRKMRWAGHGKKGNACRILVESQKDIVGSPLICCSAIVAVETCLFAELLLNNGFCIIAYFAVVA